MTDISDVKDEYLGNLPIFIDLRNKATDNLCRQNYSAGPVEGQRNQCSELYQGPRALPRSRVFTRRIQLQDKSQPSTPQTILKTLIFLLYKMMAWFYEYY